MSSKVTKKPASLMNKPMAEILAEHGSSFLSRSTKEMAAYRKEYFLELIGPPFAGVNDPHIIVTRKN